MNFENTIGFQIFDQMSFSQYCFVKKRPYSATTTHSLSFVLQLLHNKTQVHGQHLHVFGYQKALTLSYTGNINLAMVFWHCWKGVELLQGLSK